MKNGIEADCPDLDPRSFLQALVMIFEEYESGNLEPGSDKWVHLSKCREKIHKDVAEEWHKIVKMGKEEFGWTVDKVVQYWTYFRKKTPDQRRAFKRMTGLREDLAGKFRPARDGER